MPIEIRELIIRTEIVSANKNSSSAPKTRELQVLKRQLMAEVKKLVAMQQRNNLYNR